MPDSNPEQLTLQLALLNQQVLSALEQLRRIEADWKSERANWAAELARARQDCAANREMILELKTARAEDRAARKALDAERDRAQGAGAHWAQWVGIAVSIVFPLIAAAWTLYQTSPR